MQEKTCEWCGEIFVGRSNARYCKRNHHKDCEWCHKSFLIRRIKSPAKACSPECATELTRHGGKREYTCELCRKTFLSRNPRARFCKDDHDSTCAACGQRYHIANPHIMAKTCSPSCAWSTVKNVPDIVQSRKDTLRERYGVENPSQIPAVKEKKRQASLARYGVENPSQAPVVQQKRVQTFQQRYGTDHPMQHPAVQAKGKATTMERYGVENIFASEEFQTDLKSLMLERYGVENILQLPEHQLKAARSTGRRLSKINQQMHHDMFERFGVEFIFEAPFGASYYADLGCDTLLIDINPTATHNTTVSFIHLTGRCTVTDCQQPSHAPRPATYHYDRALAAQEDGITFLQMFAWHDQEQFLHVVRRHLAMTCPETLPSLGYTVLRPESTMVREVSTTTASDFFQAYHIDGSRLDHSPQNSDPAHSLVHVGVFHKNQIIHVQSMRAVDQQGHWRIVQYGFHHDYIATHAFEQCQHFFRHEYAPRTMVYVADLATEQGDVLLQHGWDSAGFQTPEPRIMPLGEEPVTVWDAGAHVLTWGSAQHLLDRAVCHP